MISVKYVSPEGLHRSPAFSQLVIVEGKASTVYIGGQNAVDETGGLVGKEDLRAQTRQVFANLSRALSAAGGSLESVVKWNIYIVQGQSAQVGFEVFREVWGRRPNAPAITVLFVAGLANPDFLIEMDAVAVVQS